MSHILVVSEDPTVLRVLETVLSRAGYDVSAQADWHSAIESFCDQDPELAIVDLKAHEHEAIHLLGYMRVSRPNVPVFIFTGPDTLTQGRQAFGQGVTQFFDQGLPFATLLEMAKQVIVRAAPAPEVPG